MTDGLFTPKSYPSVAMDEVYALRAENEKLKARENAMVAAAYSRAARQAGDVSIIALDTSDAESEMEDLLHRAWKEGLGEAAAICNQSYGGSIRDVHRAIIALINENKGDA